MYLRITFHEHAEEAAAGNPWLEAWSISKTESQSVLHHHYLPTREELFLCVIPVVLIVTVAAVDIYSGYVITQNRLARVGVMVTDCPTITTTRDHVIRTLGGAEKNSK